MRLREHASRTARFTQDDSSRLIELESDGGRVNEREVRRGEQR